MVNPSDIFTDDKVTLKITRPYMLVCDLVFNSLEKAIANNMKCSLKMCNKDRTYVWRPCVIVIIKDNDKYRINFYNKKFKTSLFSCNVTKQTVENIINSIPLSTIHVE